jgi:hypothetical protein
VWATAGAKAAASSGAEAELQICRLQERLLAAAAVSGLEATDYAWAHLCPLVHP